MLLMFSDAGEDLLTLVMFVNTAVNRVSLKNMQNGFQVNINVSVCVAAASYSSK